VVTYQGQQVPIYDGDPPEKVQLLMDPSLPKTIYHQDNVNVMVQMVLNASHDLVDSGQTTWGTSATPIPTYSRNVTWQNFAPPTPGAPATPAPPPATVPASASVAVPLPPIPAIPAKPSSWLSGSTTIGGVTVSNVLLALTGIGIGATILFSGKGR
jgi:hypothetical protein